MIVSYLQKLYKRDLEKLLREIEAYQNEANIWRIEGHISNSAGNLCMHLAGNLNAYLGAALGGTGYVRDRPFEFAGRDIPRAALLEQVRETIRVVDTVLGHLTDKDLESEYPEEVTDGRVSTGYFLLHLAMHLDYHLGQINYHRRLLDR
jgi:hypothetical protein